MIGGLELLHLGCIYLGFSILKCFGREKAIVCIHIQGCGVQEFRDLGSGVYVLGTRSLGF